MREVAQNIPQSRDEAVTELVRIGAEEAHFLAEWGASDTLQEAARLRPSWCSVDGVTPATVTTPSARAAWLCSEYKRVLHGPVETPWYGQPLALERVRCFSAAYRDLELAFLCVARLWRNMQAGYAGSPHQRRAAVDEARQVLAPLLELLGMLALRVELEEKTIVAEERPFQLDDVAKQAGAAIAAELAAALHTQLPDAHVYPNKYAQIHNLASGSRNSPKLGLLPTITVLVEDEADCYQVLHHVHKLYTPVDGGVDDSLYAPGDSGYRALNVWVVANAPNGRARISFSVAPRAQHEVNEWGAAARLMRYRDQTPTPSAWWNRAEKAYAQIAVAAP